MEDSKLTNREYPIRYIL